MKNGGKKKFPPRVAGMWINSYKDKKTRKEKKFYKLSVSVAELRKLIKKDTDAEYISLVGFRNGNKEEESHPDVQFQESKPMEKKGKRSKRRDDDEDEDNEESDDEDEEDDSEEEEEEGDDDELPF